MRAALEVLADVKRRHQGPQGIHPFSHIWLKITSESVTPPRPSDISVLQSESTQQVPLRQENIFISKGTQKVPFEFVRSLESPVDNIPFSAGISTGWWSSRVEALLGSQNVPLSWPFRACIEQQSAADLPHVRLVVVTIQGRYPVPKEC